MSRCLSQIKQATEEVDTLDVLINNAGIALFEDLSNADVIKQHLDVNFLGMFSMVSAFLPLLKRSNGASVNNLSLAALAPIPVLPAYSVSKAVAFNIT
jgi:NAD(P)-dependent dehydrogenase (short-subunit alcohol dehydrogenase family)